MLRMHVRAQRDECRYEQIAHAPVVKCISIYVVSHVFHSNSCLPFWYGPATVMKNCHHRPGPRHNGIFPKLGMGSFRSLNEKVDNAKQKIIVGNIGISGSLGELYIILVTTQIVHNADQRGGEPSMT